MLPAAILLAIISQNPVVQAEDLVNRLGAKTFAARESAGRNLVQLGRFALPALRRSQHHADLEIAERSKKLIPLAEEQAVRQRVSVVLERRHSLPDDLPKLKRFIAVTGDTREARELYAEMYLANSKLIDQIDDAGSAGSQVYCRHLERMCFPNSEEQVLGAIQSTPPPPRVVPNRAELALFLLITSHPGMTSVGVSREPPLFQKIEEANFVGPGSAPLRNLLYAWLKGPRNIDERVGVEADLVRAAFVLIGTVKMPEARAFAIESATDPKAWHVARSAALLCLTSLGRIDDVKRIAPLTSDNTLLSYSNNGSVLLGDVALCACIVLAGEKPMDYGFRGDKLLSVDDCEFENPDRRAAARKKWLERGAKK